MTAETATRWRDLLAGGNLPRFLVIGFGVWLHAADTLLVATVMPSAVAEIGGVAYISWAISLYEVTSIVAMASTGLLAAKLGLRSAMVSAALVYATGCLASALAPDMAIMLIGRALQGLGGGALVALSYIAVSQLFPERLMPRLLALVSAIWGVSALCGPLIGGIFASAGIWRGAFWAFSGQALLLALAALLMLASARGGAAMGEGSRIPYRRLAVLALAVLAIAEAGARASLFSSGLLGIAGVLLLALFFRLDGGAGERLLPRRPLDLRGATGGGLVAVFALAASTISFTTYGPLLMGLLHGADPLVGGYMVAIESASWSIAAVLFAGAGSAAEPRLIRIGALAIVGGLIGFGLTMPDGPLLALVPWAVLQGAGFGMAWAFIIRRVVAGSADDDRERASGALPTIQLLGYAIGSALSGLVANGLGFADGVALDEARLVAFWIFAAFLPLGLLGLLVAWRLSRFPAQSGSEGAARVP